MFLKIRHKLFVAILMANGLLLIVLYLSANWIFDTSFREYLDQTEAKRLQPMVEELSLLYRQRGNWRWVRDRSNRIWGELIRRYAHDQGLPPRRQGGLERPPPPDGGFDADRPPPRYGRRLLAIRPGILLQDSVHRLVIGKPDAQQHAFWIPVEVDGQVAGYLGFVRRVDIGGDLDRLFVDRVQGYLLWLIVGILTITALVAIPLATRFVGPIEKLRAAFRELASGNYEVSLEKSSNDEIGDLQIDFNRLTETMKGNLESRQQWISDISHELRTPIAVLQGEIEATMDGVRETGPASVKSLHEEVLRLSRLVNDLHDLSLSDVGALTYQNREVDIVRILQSVIEQQKNLFETSCFSLDFKTEHESLVVFADARRLEQLFTNLANNSRFYTSTPGVIRVTVTKMDQTVCIDWSDSAPGVVDGDLDRLFDRLYRVEASRNRNTGGSGLGLSICKSIVDASQGRIQAEHSPLGGITIKIIFPLIQSI